MAYLYGSVARRLRSDPEIECIVWNGSIDGPNRGYLGIVADIPRPPTPKEKGILRHPMQDRQKHSDQPDQRRQRWAARMTAQGRCCGCGVPVDGYARCRACRIKAAERQRRYQA